MRELCLVRAITTVAFSSVYAFPFRFVSYKEVRSTMQASFEQSASIINYLFLFLLICAKP